jgi:CheY-like chemotaxis protein
MRSRALIVDDDPAVCEFIQAVLVSTGMEVLTLTSSEEAVARLREEKFAVVLLDFCMPAPNGIDLARQIRASGINLKTPIILMSDDQSTAAVSEGFAAGASLFLYKPIDKARLLRLVRTSRGAIEHERRRFARVALRCKARLGLEKEEYECETIDVSLSGMLIQGCRTLPVGSSVRISLEFSPQMKPLVGSGSVVRVLSGHRMGIQLNHLTVGESNRLQEFLLPLILRDAREANPVKTSPADGLAIHGSSLRSGHAH